MILLLFLGVNVGSATDTDAAGTDVVAVLVVEGAVRHIIRNFAHALRVHRHRLVRLLRHSKHLTHLGWCRRRTTYPTLKIALLDQPVLLAELLEVWVFQRLACT